MPRVAPREALWIGCLAAFDEVSFRLRGACMTPAAPEGGRVTLVDARRRRPRFGDVLLVRTPAGLRLHRLVWPPRPSSAARLRTLADRGAALDPALAPEDVLAVAAAVERDGQRVSPRGRLLAARGLLRVGLVRLRRAWSGGA
jgi:hypothetical protein